MGTLFYILAGIVFIYWLRFAFTGSIFDRPFSWMQVPGGGRFFFFVVALVLALLGYLFS